MADTSKYTSVHLSEQQQDLVHHATPRRPWQPSFLKRLPWTGVLSIFLALGCGIAAICLGLAVDGKRLDYWTINGYVVQPAVLLSVLATVANALLVFAFTKGATIHWWHSAIRGATLKELHSSYAYGSGLTAIFTSVAAFNTVALAAVFMPILLADGPLFQRAMGIVQRSSIADTNRTIPLSPSPFVSGATAFYGDHEPLPSLYSPLFAKVLQQYTNRDPIVFPKGACDGTCELDVSAPGWDIECSSNTTSYQLATYYDSTAYYKDMYPNGTERLNSTYDGPPMELTAFSVGLNYRYDYGNVGGTDDFAYSNAVNWVIDLDATFKSTPGINGTLTHHFCTLHEALVKYPLRLQNETVTLAAMPLSVNRTVERVYRQSEESGLGSTFPSTLGGFWLALQNQYNGSAIMSPTAGWYRVAISNAISNQYLQVTTASDLNTANITFGDPMDDMVSMANELAFRTAYTMTTTVPDSDYYNLTSTQPYIYSPNLTLVHRPLQQKAMVTDRSVEAVYSTERGWLAGGFVVMVLACLLIAPTYWGFWRLGREVSMSPIEIGRAFNAAVFADADPNATGEDLKKYLGDTKVNLAPATIARSRSMIALNEQLQMDGLDSEGKRLSPSQSQSQASSFRHI